MNLIDRQQAFVTLTEHYQHRMLIEHLMLSEALDRVPTVDAIPIEWINNYMDNRLTKGSLFYSCMSEFMRDWKKEQEETNGRK